MIGDDVAMGVIRALGLEPRRVRRLSLDFEPGGLSAATVTMLVDDANGMALVEQVRTFKLVPA